MAEKHNDPVSWLSDRHYFLLVIALVFLFLASATLFISLRHHTIHAGHILEEDRETGNLLALLINQHLLQVLISMESYSREPLLVQAAIDKNVAKAGVILTDIKKSDPDIDMLTITDRQGTLWAAQPERPELLGMSLAHRGWYKRVSREWKSDVSDVVMGIVRERELAIRFSVPVRNGRGGVIGILVNAERTAGFSRFIRRLPFDSGVSISICDRKGQMIYSSRYDYDKNIRVYPFHDAMRRAAAARLKTFAIADPEIGGKTRYISFAPVENFGWTVFYGRDKQSILLSEFSYFIQVAATVLLLFLTIVMMLAYLRKKVTIEQVRRQLQAERIISDGKEKLRNLFLHQQTLLAAIPDIIMEVDVNKVYTWANPAGLDFFGEDVIGKEAAFYFAGEQETYEAVQPLFNGEKESVYLESFQRHRDGRIRLLAWWCQALRDKDGRMTGSISSARDITVQKQAQEEIRTLNAELERRVLERTARLEDANRELESFSYSVSHDLRAPLRSIDGFSQALLEDYRDKPLDSTGLAYLERVRKAAQRMGMLIDDMLKLARVSQAGLQLETVDLSRMIRAIADAHLRADPERAVEVTVEEGCVVQGDQRLLRIAMENFLDNAFKFTGKSDHPRIEFGRAVESGGQTAFFIRDNGVGFDMAYAGKLFGAFQRLHTADEFPGTGVGLATAQRVIHRHGGRIRAEGEVAKGATFYFTVS